MPNITALFWDIGGVLLTNAWDREQRTRALAHFNLPADEFEERHQMVVSSFERGLISLDEYLDRTAFCHPQGFSTQAFRDYMFSLSQPHAEALALARELAGSGQYLMGSINNESRELNHYRIQTFGLRDIFTLFVSSCYVGFRKPEEAIYKLAISITQKDPAECCFIDDRALNLESAARLGMNTIQMENAAQLRRDLQELGVQI